MWHASASSPIARLRKKFALKVLSGVGSARLGEWHDERGMVYHVRRRLTPSEAESVGEVLDLRGTPAGQERAAVLLDALQRSASGMVVQEVEQLALQELNQPGAKP